MTFSVSWGVTIVLEVDGEATPVSSAALVNEEWSGEIKDLHPSHHMPLARYTLLGQGTTLHTTLGQAVELSNDEEVAIHEDRDAPDQENILETRPRVHPSGRHLPTITLTIITN